MGRTTQGLAVSPPPTPTAASSPTRGLHNPIEDVVWSANSSCRHWGSTLATFTEFVERWPYYEDCRVQEEMCGHGFCLIRNGAVGWITPALAAYLKERGILKRGPAGCWCNRPWKIDLLVRRTAEVVVP